MCTMIQLQRHLCFRSISNKEKVATAGKFFVAMPVQKAGTKVNVIVRDSEGNNGPYTVRMVKN